MSLYRAYRVALARPLLCTHFPAHSRLLTSDSVSQPTQSGEQEIVKAVDGEVLTADVISGAPGKRLLSTRRSFEQACLAELRHRAVRIYQPTRNTMQSGSGKSERWRIDWDILSGGGRWENPLMGFASSYVHSSDVTGPYCSVETN